MPHIHTKSGEYDHTASAFVFRIDGDEPRLLLHKHKKTGLYQQFGGHIELDENPWQAIVHELREESGYDTNQIKVLQPRERQKVENKSYTVHPVPITHSTHRFDDKHFHTDVAYAFVTDQKPKHKAGEGESQDFILVNKSELLDIPSSKIPDGVRDAGLFVFDVCLTKWERVSPKNFS